MQSFETALSRVGMIRLKAAFGWEALVGRLQPTEAAGGRRPLSANKQSPKNAAHFRR